MSTIIDRFFISVGLKTDDVERGVNDLNNKLSSSFKGIAASIAAPLMGALSVGSMFQSFIEEAANVDKLSKTLGVNIETMQAWMGAAESMGAQGDEMAELFHDVNDWASDLLHNDAGTLKEFVERGLVDGFTDAQGQMLKTEDIIMKISGAVKKLGAQEGSGLLRRIGVGNKEMAGFLMMGPEQISEYLKRQKELGTYTKEDAQAARDFTRALSELTRAFKMALVPILAKATPLLSKLGNVMTDIFISIRKHAIVLQTVVVGLATVMLIKLLPAIKATTIAFLRSPLGQIIAMFVMLGLVIEDLFVYMQGGQSALPGLWAKFGTGEEIMAKFNDIMKTVGEYTDYAMQLWNEWGPIILKVIGFLGLIWGVVMPIVKVLLLLWGGIVKVWGALQIVWNAIQGIIILLSALAGVGVGTAIAIVAALVSVIAVLYWVYENWEMIKEAACSFGEVCGRILDDVTTAFSRFVDAVTGLMKRFFNWLGDSFIEKASAIKNGLLEVIGLGRDADKVAASGRGGGNQSWYTDNSTKNIYPMHYDDKPGTPGIPSPSLSLVGLK